MTTLNLAHQHPTDAAAARRPSSALELLHSLARLEDARTAGQLLSSFLGCDVYEVGAGAVQAQTAGAGELAAGARAAALHRLASRSSQDERPAWVAAPLGRGTRDGVALVAQRSGEPFNDEELSLLETAAALWPPGGSEGKVALWDSADVAALADSIQDPIALLDARGGLRLANAAYRRLMADAGVESGPLSSAPEKIVPRDERGRPAPNNEAISRALEGREIQFKRVIRMADGHDRSFSITGVPVRGPDSAVIGVCVVLHEETERLQRDLELRLLDEIRRGLAQAGGLRHAGRALCRRVNTLLPWVDMAAVYMLDGDELVLLSQAGFPTRAARMLAPTAASSPQRLITALQTNQPTVFEAERDEPSSEWSRRVVVASGAATFVNLPLRSGTRTFGVLTLAARRPHAPSRVELTLLEALAAQVGAELESVRGREESEAERARLRAVLDQLPEGVLLYDAAGRLVMNNRRAVEILGQDVDPATPIIALSSRYGFFHADGRPYAPAEQPLVQVFTTGHPVLGVEQLVRRPDGNELPLVANVAPVRDQAGQLAAVIVVFQDITSLREMDRLKDEFLSIAGHELRTPIAAIRGYAQLLRRRGAQLGSAASEQWLAAINEQTDQMSALVDELLDVSRIRTGRMSFTLAPTDLAALARKAAAQVEAQRPGSIELRIERRPLVNADAGRLQQVVANLLSNANKYSRPSTPITVSVSSRDGQALLAVRDRGIGVAPEEREHLFERFYRAPGANEHAGGLGLGLYLCAEIVANHGGMIEVESEPGAGSTFTVVLPLLEDAAGD